MANEVLLHMYALITGGTENALASIDIPEDGTFQGIQMSHNAQLNADNEASQIELSFIATNQITQNDSRGTICISTMRMGLLTSGAGVGSGNWFVPMQVPVSGGERLYVHSVGSAGVGGTVSVILHFAPSRGIARISRRRT